MLYQAGLTLIEVVEEIGSNTRMITFAMEERGEYPIGPAEYALNSIHRY